VLKQRHFLSLSDFSAFDLKTLLATAAEMKKHPKPFRKVLKGQVLALLFERPAPCLRLGFEVGMGRLGGTAHFLGSEALRGEPGLDTANILSRYADGIVLRAHSHQTALDLASHGTVPVVNGQTDREDPCQALADFQTLLEKFGRLEGLRLTYLGAGSPIAHALLLGTARTGMDCTLIVPRGGLSSCLPELLGQAQAEHAKQGTRLQLTEDLHAARGSHAIYTGPWLPAGQSTETAYPEALQSLAVTQAVMELAGSDAVFMHCLPAHRGREVAPEVIDGPQSVVYDQAENRLWTQMAVLYHLLGGA